MNDEQLQNQVEDPAEMGEGEEGERKRWLTEIMLSGKNDKDWRKRGDAVVKRYRDDRSAVERIETKMNILWSNTQTIIPALYANTPNPMCDRRNKQKDPVGLMAARIMEGGLEYALDNDDFDSVMRYVVEDYQLPGRAIARVFYRPEMAEKRMDANPMSYATDYQPNYDDPENPFEIQGDPIYAEDTQFDENGAFTMEEMVSFEEVEVKYVHWKDFRMGKAIGWKSVPWLGFSSYLTKAECKDRFGAEVAEKISYRHRPDDKEHLQAVDEDVELLMKCEVWEVWDKVDKKVIWVCKD